MGGNWAFSWVQIVAHNWRSLGWRFALLTLVALAGLAVHPLQGGIQPFFYPLGSVVVMSVVMWVVFQSGRTAMLNLGLGVLILALTYGLVSWLRGEVDAKALILGGVVVLTMMTSNLVHVLGAILREMARGQFQHDAVAEGLKHNAAPIVLANTTTVLGFVVAAWFHDGLDKMAWVVGLGALASLFVTLTWLPWILLKWFLEFRVGNPEDRHGFSPMVRWLKHHPVLVRSLAAGGALFLIAMTAWMLVSHTRLMLAVGVMLAATWGLLVLAWQQWRLPTLTVLLNWFAVATAVAIVLLWVGDVYLLALMVPLGLVIDDSIHFFTRYHRAQRIALFNTPELRMRFALGSVGRALWVTSILLMAGLSVIALYQDPVIRQAVLLMDIAMVIATATLVLWVPAFVLSFRKVEDNA